MLELNLRTTSGDISSFKRIVSDGIVEEKKKIDYALEKTTRIIKKYCPERQPCPRSLHPTSPTPRRHAAFSPLPYANWHRTAAG